MTYLKKFPWIYFVLLLLTYFTFGWSYGEWANRSLAEFKQLYWLEKINLDPTEIDILGGSLLVAIVLVFTGVVTLLTGRIINWLKTQLQVFTSIIGGALAVVLILCLFPYFVRFLLLLAAAALLRIELRGAGFGKRQAAIMLAVSCLTGFVCGVLSFTFLGKYGTEELSLTPMKLLDYL
jgi:hypothetical protein